jgi:hypothetical protein
MIDLGSLYRCHSTYLTRRSFEAVVQLSACPTRSCEIQIDFWGPLCINWSFSIYSDCVVAGKTAGKLGGSWCSLDQRSMDIFDIFNLNIIISLKQSPDGLVVWFALWIPHLREVPRSNRGSGPSMVDIIIFWPRYRFFLVEAFSNAGGDHKTINSDHVQPSHITPDR